jgi:hypothetical protein
VKQRLYTSQQEAKIDVHVLSKSVWLDSVKRRYEKEEKAISAGQRTVGAFNIAFA